MTAISVRLFGLLACTWGGVLIYFYQSPRLVKYLVPDFHQFLLIGGVGMLILGIYSVINPKPREEAHDCGHDHHDHDEHHHHHGSDDGCDHEHDDGHGPLITILLTMIPLLLAMTYTEDRNKLGGVIKKGLYQRPSVMNAADRPPFTLEELEERVPKNAKGEFELSIMTAYLAAGDSQIQGIFEELPVEFEGRMAPEKLNNEAGDRMRIFRKIITCCGADLQVVGLSMQFPDGVARPSPDDWVKAGGILVFEESNGQINPLLKVREVVQAEEPYSEFRLRQ